jgi:hypothetical protein
MASLLIAEEEDQKQWQLSKQGKSNKARKQRNRRKANPDLLDTGSKEPDEAIGGSVASSSGTRDKGVERDEKGRDAACHSKSDGEIDALGGEENAGPVFNNGGQGHNESERSIGKNV